MYNPFGLDPFGLMSCEAEVSVLGSDYSDLYFNQAPFNNVAIHPKTYLIVGRRGSGKTALMKYFSFQNTIPDPLCIEVREPGLYREILAEISQRISESRTTAIPPLRRVWEFVIWKLISHELRHGAENEDMSEFVEGQIKYLMDRFDRNDERTAGARLKQIVEAELKQIIEKQIVDAENRDQAKQAAKPMVTRPSIIIAIETFEQYEIRDRALMNALSALIEYAASFNLKYAPKGIHLKVFVAGEVFPYMNEAVLLNTLKSVQHPVYLLWRPKDLLRLISWRLYRHLQARGLWRNKMGPINWESYRDVHDKVWIPHFGRELTNARGKKERTWPYVLRHTQMRPRQLIRICNSIANEAINKGTFPQFKDKHIIAGINAAESGLANEILNSFSEIHPNVANIVREGLKNIPKYFYGNELDKRAHWTASLWPPGEYLPWNFRQMVAEVGIIGRITRVSDGPEDVDDIYRITRLGKDPQEVDEPLLPQYVDADFAYASEEPLGLTERDPCVVHPMFYRKLDVDFRPEELDERLRRLPQITSSLSLVV